MLELVIPSDINEGWDEIKGEFIYEELNKPKTIMLEHSLVPQSIVPLYADTSIPFNM